MLRLPRLRGPRSLMGRVFALYTAALAGFVVVGLALFYRHQFTIEVEDTQQRAEALMAVVAPAVTDSAVIGDYDTIQRMLERAIRGSDFASAVFIDTRGGRLVVKADADPADAPPRWLSELIANRLYDTNLPVTAGGRDYGVLRFSFAADRIAGGLWQQGRFALLLALLALAGGLVGIHLPLKRWLGDLDRLQRFDHPRGDGGPSTLPDAADAPIELQRTFQTLKRAAEAREAALTALRGVLEGLMPQAAGPASGGDDIEAISRLIAQLTLTLQERGAQLDAIFALSPDGFVSFDGDRRVHYVSPAFAQLTGLGERDLRGLTEDGFLALWRGWGRLRPEQLPGFAALRPGEGGTPPARLLLDLERPRRRVLEVALRSGDGQAVSQLLHVRDVTHETEVDQMKSEFLSTAAHELRTPIASIYGFVELLLHRKMSPERQRDAMETVHRQTGLMITIINELLDLARIEARRGKDFEFERTELAPLVRECAHDFTVPAGRAAPVLKLPAAPVWVSVDRGKLLQALRNVLSNAYKYSPGGGEVTVTLQCSPADGGAPTATLSIRDSGIGMTPEQLRRVCERFYRADSSGSIPGTGLGMAIVKEIVELMGGRLSLASTPGEGTTVHIVLPRLAERVAPTAPVSV